MDETAVRKEIRIAFEYAHFHEDWVTPVADALAGVTVQEATWTPNPSMKCIWQIVLHMSLWAENSVERWTQRVREELPGRPAEGTWGSLPSSPDEAGWDAARRRLEDALSALRVHIETTPLEAMLEYAEAGYSHLADLLCRPIHNAYHIGQITVLREWWKAQKTVG